MIRARSRTRSNPQAGAVPLLQTHLALLLSSGWQSFFRLGIRIVGVRMDFGMG